MYINEDKSFQYSLSNVIVVDEYIVWFYRYVEYCKKKVVMLRYVYEEVIKWAYGLFTRLSNDLYGETTNLYTSS